MCLFKKQQSSTDNSKKDIKSYKPLGRNGELYSFFIVYTDGSSERVDIALNSRMYEKIYLFHLAHEKQTQGITCDDIELFETIDGD